MFKRVLLMQQVPQSKDFGLLALRVIPFLTLFLKHGTEKLFTFSAMSRHFPDPVHIGPVPSLVFAMIADGICTVLLVLGLATRWAALISFVNLSVAWGLVHHFALVGKGNDHGELIVLYIAAVIALFFTGPGRFSIDALLERSEMKDPVRERHARVAQV